MFKLTKLSDLLDSTSTGVRAIIAAVFIIGLLVAGFTTGKAIVALPGKFDDHDKTTQQQTEVLKTMLCIQIADHRHLDWKLCYINPELVLPSVKTAN